MGEGSLARFKRVKRPVAREEGLMVEYVGDETVIYDNKTTEAHCLSPLAAVVFAHCNGETTIDELGTLATERLGEPVDEPRVIDALVQLQDRNLLVVPPRSGLSRRQMIQKSAAAGGALVGASLITTILAPTAAAQGSQFCSSGVLCRCCGDLKTFGVTCPAINPVGGNCNSSGQNCCEGQGCNCTKVASEGFPHCKPGNAPSTVCDAVKDQCNCVGTN
jgi:hypothetical protein